MAEKKIAVDLNLSLNQILQARLENLGSDPTGAGLVAGRLWFNTADSRPKFYDGAAVRVLATLADFNNIGTLIGGWDASGDTLPAFATDGRDDPSTIATDSVIKAGDRFFITAASTTALGLSTGNKVLEIGDAIVALTDNPTAANEWMAINVNVDLSSVASTEVVAVAALTAATPTTVTFTTLTTINMVQVKENATGDLIELNIDGCGTGTITLESNVTLGALTVLAVGVA